MRKKLAVLLTFVLMIGVVGCQKEGTEEKTEAPENIVTEESVVINDTEETSQEEENAKPHQP